MFEQLVVGQHTSPLVITWLGQAYCQDGVWEGGKNTSRVLSVGQHMNAVADKERTNCVSVVGVVI